MAPVVFSGPDGVKSLIVKGGQPLPPLRVLPYPFLESVLKGLLLLLGYGSLLRVGNTVFAVPVVDHIIDTDLPHIQSPLQNFIGIHAGRTVSSCGRYVASGIDIGSGDMPFAGQVGIFHVDPEGSIHRRLENFPDERLNVRGRYPGGTQSNGNFRCFQVHRLGSRQGLDGNLEPLALLLGQRIHKPIGHSQLLPDVSGKVFVCCDQRVEGEVRLLKGYLLRVVYATAHIPENNAGQLRFQIRFRLAGQARHIGKVYPAQLPQGDRQSIRGRIRMGDGFVGPHGTAEENIRFPGHVPVAVGFFQGGQQREHAVLLEYPGIGAVIQVSEFCRKTVIQVIEPVP